MPSSVEINISAEECLSPRRRTKLGSTVKKTAFARQLKKTKTRRGRLTHSQRSLDPIIQRLFCVENDKTYTVDEFRSTITCSSCIEITTKQIVQVGENGRRRIKGAVICKNNKCPRRLSSSSCTINRDRNGAMNIVLIGFSCIVS